MSEYAAARISQGFKELLDRLRVSDQPDYATQVRSNTEYRERALERVKSEYQQIGMVPPSEIALSVTARLELDIGIRHPVQEAAE